MEVIDKPSIKKDKIFIDYIPLALLALFVVFFLPTVNGLFERWIKWDESLSHGLLVNGMFIYLLYKSTPWQNTQNSKLTSSLLLIALALTSVMWFFFRAAQIFILEQMLLLVLLAGFYACTYGLKTALNFRLLLLLPIFTIPAWDQLTTPLVNLSGWVVGNLVQMIAIPAVIDGNNIFIPFGQIVIADGCSGLRYLEIALALAFIIALLNNYSERQLIPALIIAATLGLFANWLRIFILVLIGYESKMQSSLMANHELFGWALFGIMCLPAIYFAPIVTQSPKKRPENLIKPYLLLPVFALAIGPILNFFITSEPKVVELNRLVNANFDPIPESKMPLFITAPTESVKENYYTEANGAPLFIQVDQYQRKTANDKLVPYIARLYNAEEWLIDSSKEIKINSHAARITHFRKTGSNTKILQLQWFDVGGYTANTIAMAKFLQIPALLMGHNNFKIITLQSHCSSVECESETATLISQAPLVLKPKPAL
jgi:exosortase